MDTGERASEQATLAAERVEPLPGPSPVPGETESTEIVANDLAVEEAEEASIAAVAEEASLAEVTEEASPAEAAEEAPLAGLTEEASPVETTEEEAESSEGPEEAEEEVVDDRAWYVIHCYSGYESKVKHNLEQRIETMQMQDKIFQVVVPTEDEIEVRDGKRRVVERRVFPGYILVQMVLTDDSWYVVRNTPGVTGFVGMGNEPTPLRPEEVQAILKRMEAEAPKVKVTYKPGQKVRIVDGPFNEFIGVVDDIDMERAKVRVMVSFFGRETPVELDFLQVEKA
jgi:transcriptional antiterminator NusG